ncbi:YkgJ family cysteine cluster protein [bacterium]|nr:YkgJ family cysteine cluster protein [bacterium]
MNCRPGCAACCIVISISSPIPGMPHGKPAGVRCIHLSEDNRCRIHSSPEYPDVCRNFTPGVDICGSDTGQAMRLLAQLEAATRPEV